MASIWTSVKRLARGPYLRVAAVGIACALTCYLIIAATFAPAKFSLKPGDIAPATVMATKDVEDTRTTQAERERAIARVEKHVVTDTSVSVEAMTGLRGALTIIQSKHAETEALIGPLRGQYDDASFAQAALALLGADNLSSIARDIGAGLKQEQVDALLLAETRDIAALCDEMQYAMQWVLDQGVQEETRGAALITIEDHLARPASLVPEELKAVGLAIADAYLKPNAHVNMEQYEKEVAAATEAIAPIMYKQGEAIVREGGRVTEAQYAVMLELGLLTERTDAAIYIGMAGLVALLFTVIVAYLAVYERPILRSAKHALLMAVIIVLMLGVAVAFKVISPWLVPLQFGSLLIALLIKPRVSIMVNFVLAVLLSIVCLSSGQLLSQNMFSIALVGLIGGTHAVYLVRRSYLRAGLFFAGVVIGLSNMAVVLCIGLMTTARLADLFVDAAWALGGGVLSAILALGLTPLFEAMFSLITPAKLLELSNPNQPLLRRMLLEAPGTYHHSILVANLAESAVEQIGGDDMLARVGAYYHDTGKLKRPVYFKENQLGLDNPHDKMEPEVSSSILKAHPLDGVELASREKLPQPILDIILQHHGDSLTGYFYAQAVNAKGEENVDPKDFRYAGPRPQTAEAAVVMLADTVEAAVRSISGPTHEKITEFVHKLIKAKLEDGQLDDAPLTLRDLGKIADAFCTVLKGVYHERVEYPQTPLKLESPKKARAR